MTEEKNNLGIGLEITFFAENQEVTVGFRMIFCYNRNTTGLPRNWRSSKEDKIEEYNDRQYQQ